MTEQICTRCVMDTSAPDISFDAEGRCNFCTDYFVLRAKRLPGEENRAAELQALLASIRAAGRGKPYDCVLGVSGGLDSSYAIYQACKLGLRPLAVHLDNGWNSELSNRNIEVLVRGLKVDLVTHVIDWDEFRDLQRAFFAAHVVDIELLTDNAIMALMVRTARQFRLRNILTGYNMANEGMRMPRGWNHSKLDSRNIWGIHRQFGKMRRIQTLPTLSVMQHLWHEKIGRLRWSSLLNYLPYDRDEAIRVLQDAVGWRAYEKKHYESVFTRFYQGYILPKKFGVDKRKLHYANLVCTGQLARDEALRRLREEEPYEDAARAAEDRAYVIKKLGMSDTEFDAYLQAPPVPHTAYPTTMPLINMINRVSMIIKGRPTF